MLKRMTIMLAVLAIVAGAAAAATLEEGVVDSVRGTVRVIALDGTARPAAAGDYVLGNEAIETAADGFARVIMADGSALVVQEQSRVEIADSRTNPDGRGSVTLFLGRVWAEIVGSEDGTTAFEVHTPTATCGVRGTEFETGVGLDGATRVGVDKGLVDVVGESGKVAVGAGKETTVDWQGAPAVSDYDRSDERWTQWVRGRQDQIVRHGKVLVPLIVGDVKRTRADLTRLQAGGKKMFGRFKAQAERQRDNGREVRFTPRQKREFVTFIRDAVGSLKELHDADRRMLTRYYLVRRIDADVKANPGAYSPEFKDLMARTMTQLDEIDVEGLHRQNQEIITGAVDFVDNFARKHQLGKYKDGPGPDRKAMLEQARKNYRDSHPD